MTTEIVNREGKSKRRRQMLQDIRFDLEHLCDELEVFGMLLDMQIKESKGWVEYTPLKFMRTRMSELWETWEGIKDDLDDPHGPTPMAPLQQLQASIEKDGAA